MPGASLSPLKKGRIPALMALAGALAGLGLGRLGRSMNDHGTAVGAPAPHQENQSVRGRRTGSGEAEGPAPETAAREARDITVRAGRRTGVERWLELLASAECASVPVLAELTELLRGEPAALEMVGARWAELDPRDLLSALRRKSLEPSRMPGVHGPDSGQKALQRILAAAWFRKNPAELLAALNGAEAAVRLIPAKEEYVRCLAATDGEQALKQAMNWRISPGAEAAAPILSWVRGNAQKAAQLMLERDADYGLEKLVCAEVIKIMGRTDPAGAMDLAMAAHSKNNWRRIFAAGMVGEWARHDLKAAADYLAGVRVGRELLPELVGPLMEVWGGQDAAAAMEWSARHLIGGARNLVPAALVKSLAARDPVEAARFVDQLDPGTGQYDAMRQLTYLSVRGRDKAALLEAFDWMMAMPDPALRSVAMDSGASEIMAAAPEEVLAWLGRPEGGQAPASLLVTAGRYLVRQDGPAAMEWTASLRPEVVDEVRQRVLQGWNASDPNAAQAWVRSLPDGAERATRVAAVTSAFRDAGITAWLGSLPASDLSAIREGLGNAWSIDPVLKAELTGKYK